jgi:hypothetical protein
MPEVFARQCCRGGAEHRSDHPALTPATQASGASSHAAKSAARISATTRCPWVRDSQLHLAFGYGVSYTSFKLSGASVRQASSGALVHFVISNRGARSGADVVQAYVRCPRSAAEPPAQLRAFERVLISPNSAKELALRIPWSGFQIYRNGSFTLSRVSIRRLVAFWIGLDAIRPILDDLDSC